jgi:hypothetical protein
MSLKDEIRPRRTFRCDSMVCRVFPQPATPQHISALIRPTVGQKKMCDRLRSQDERLMTCPARGTNRNPVQSAYRLAYP